MHTVRVQTAQNVDIEYEVASVGDRIMAYLIDLMIVVAYAVALVLLFAAGPEFLPFEELSPAAFGLMILLALPVFLYHLVLEVTMDGQSFGKKYREIKVIMLDGSQPTLGSYLLRWLLRLIDLDLFWGGVALLTILINGKGQRLGDLAAGTTVIKLKPHATLEDTIFTQIDEDYDPVFPQVATLDEQTITTVQEVLNQAPVLKAEQQETAEHLLLKTKKILEGTLGIKSNLPPREFLETIMKDYNAMKVGSGDSF